jgi:hypothetical protein
VYSAIAAVAALNDAIEAINSDEFLTPAGKAAKLEQLAPKWQETTAKLAANEADVTSMESDFRAAMADFFRGADAPEYGQGDMVAYLIDQELRQHFAAQSLDERTRLLREIEAPENERLRIALARSPIPSRERELVRKKMRNARQDADPAYWNGLKTREAAIEWARINLRLLTHTVEDAAARAARRR